MLDTYTVKTRYNEILNNERSHVTSATLSPNLNLMLSHVNFFRNNEIRYYENLVVKSAFKITYK